MRKRPAIEESSDGQKYWERRAAALKHEGKSEGEIEEALEAEFNEDALAYSKALKKIGTTPSSSPFTWDEAVKAYKLPKNLEDGPWRAFEPMKMPMVFLPKRVHLELYKRGYHAMDGYGGTPGLITEASVVRILEPLKGFNGTWLLVAEMKARLGPPTKLCDQFAQAMAMMADAFKESQTMEHPQTMIFGVLTDRRYFWFLGFDGGKWYHYGIVEFGGSKKRFLRSMMVVSNVLFAMTLEAYLLSLTSLKAASLKRVQANDTLDGLGQDAEAKALGQRPPGKKSSRPSLDYWVEAEASAKLAKEQLSMPVDGKLVDSRLEEGLVRLGISVSVIPRKDLETIDYVTEEDIHSVAEGTTAEFFEEQCAAGFAE
ncbi:hypothetical protein MNV49_002186 [Pseudohyphozyma bogoriensis]|nr:hypothetical protein MNV49_002186 [Pseudohyphozyma bogoriensis]